MAAPTAPQVHFDADKVRRLIAEYLGIDAKQITDEAHFSDDLGIDWLDQLELMIMIEDEFIGVEFSDTTALELVADLIRYIEIKATNVKNHQNAAPAFRRSAA
jgi:acyl carrier protein